MEFTNIESFISHRQTRLPFFGHVSKLAGTLAGTFSRGMTAYCISHTTFSLFLF